MIPRWQATSIKEVAPCRVASNCHSTLDVSLPMVHHKLTSCELHEAKFASARNASCDALAHQVFSFLFVCSPLVTLLRHSVEAP